MYHIHILHGEAELETINARLVSSCCGGESISIGSVCAAELTVKVFGSLALTDEIITAAVQQDGKADRPLGTFRVTTCQQNSGTTTITAYDAACYALGADYTPTVASGASVAAVLADIASQCGLNLAVLPSAAGVTTVTGDLTGHTCREMVGYMAALVGRNAVIDRDGALKLIWFTGNAQAASPDDYYSGGLSLTGESVLAGVRMTKTVTVRTTGTDGTVTEVEQTTNYDAGSGTGTVIAVDNPYATQDIVDAVWAKIGGLGTYRTGSCAMFGGILTEPGDLLTVIKSWDDDQLYVLPCMTVQLELDGGCKCTVSASGQSQTEADAKVLGPTGRALSKIEADIARFKDLYANNAEINRAKITELLANFAEIETGDIGGFVFHDGYLESTGYYQNDEDFTVDTALYLKAADAEDDGEPPKIAFRSRGSAMVEYETSAQLTVGGGSTRATGVSAFDWVELSAMDDVQDLKSYIKLWAKNRLVEISADTLYLWGKLHTDDEAHFGGSVYTGGKLAWSDGTPGGILTNMGRLLLCSSDTSPGIQFFRRLATQPTSAIYETANGLLTVRDNFAVSGTLTVGGFAVPKIQNGSVSISGVTSTHKEFSVTFPNAFSATPNVQLTARHNSTSAVQVKLKSVSATGFTADIWSGSTTGITPGVDWLATL